MSLAENIAVCKISLDERNFLHADHSLLVTIRPASERFETRYKTLPRVLRNMFLCGIIRLNNKLYENVSFVPKSQIAKSSFGVLSSGALCRVQSTANLDKLGW
jgi:hypothetical protein